MDNSDCTQVRFNFGDGEVFWGEVTDEEQEIMSQQRYGDDKILTVEDSPVSQLNNQKLKINPWSKENTPRIGKVGTYSKINLPNGNQLINNTRTSNTFGFKRRRSSLTILAHKPMFRTSTSTRCKIGTPKWDVKPLACSTPFTRHP